MRRPRREAHHPKRGAPLVPLDSAQQVECAGRMDAEGRLAAPPSRQQSHYACLFSEEERERGLPAELMRLARRHGCVRDRVLRRDGHGQLRMQRIALQSLHDDEGRLTGFLEMLEDAD